MNKILRSPLFFLVFLISALYYNLFIFQKIPFPADLLIGSYFPWLDYFKMPVKNPLISDVFSQIILWKYLSVKSLLNFEWPLWNPYSFTGNPLLATYHSAALYPLNILLLLPKYLGWGLFIYSQTLIASVTFFLFISQFTKSNFARITGAIIYSQGSLMTTWLELGTPGHAMAWLPLALYFTQKFTESNNFRFVLGLLISLVLIILSGSAQVTTYSYVIIFFYYLWVVGKKNLLSKGLFLLIALLFSVLIAAPQLLPSYELLQKSIRQTENYSAEANFGLLSIKDGFKFFIADYFGNTVTRNYRGNLNYAETSGFLGTLSLPLLIYSFFRIRGKQSFFFSAVLSISLILGFDNPVSHTIYQTKIPLLTSSYASRILFITLLASSVLVCLAIDNIIKKKDYSFFLKSVFWALAAVLGIITGNILVNLFIRNIPGWVMDERYLRIFSENQKDNLNNLSVALKNSLIPLIILSALVVITIFSIRSKVFFFKAIPLIPLVILSLFTFDMGRYFLKFNPFIASELIFPKTPSLEFLQKQPGFFRVGREHAEILPPNTWMAYELQSYEGYDPVYLKQYGEFIHFLNGGDIRSGNTTRYAEISSNYSSPFLDAANDKYLLAVLRDSKGRIPGNMLDPKVKNTNFKVIFKDKLTVILENPNAMERVYFAKKTFTGTKDYIKNQFMINKNFDPRETIALSKDLGIKEVSGSGSATILNYSANKVKMKTNTESDQILVLADQYEDGWKATIDGKITEISPANLIFRAVKVPKGEHEVLFYYRPNSFENGLKTAAAAILILIVISIIAVKRNTF